MKFKNSVTQELFDLWIGPYPETFNPLDRQRMYNFIYSMFINDEFIDVESLSEILEAKKEWSKKYADEKSNLFMNKIENTLEVLRYLRDSGRLA